MIGLGSGMMGIMRRFSLHGTLKQVKYLKIRHGGILNFIKYCFIGSRIQNLSFLPETRINGLPRWYHTRPGMFLETLEDIVKHIVENGIITLYLRAIPYILNLKTVI